MTTILAGGPAASNAQTAGAVGKAAVAAAVAPDNPNTGEAAVEKLKALLAEAQGGTAAVAKDATGLIEQAKNFIANHIPGHDAAPAPAAPAPSAAPAAPAAVPAPAVLNGAPVKAFRDMTSTEQLAHLASVKTKLAAHIADLQSKLGKIDGAVTQLDAAVTQAEGLASAS